ncbi:MAG: pilus assembly protein PilP [Myxococcota bacterium]
MSIAVATAMGAGLLAATGCGGDMESGPTVSEYSERRQELKARLARKDRASEAQPEAEVKPAPIETTIGGVGLVAGTFYYDPKGKRDPFRSFLFDPPGEAMVAEGPLERFDVSQLSLVAVIWDVESSRALVQDPSGMSFIIAKGTRVGKNAGRVTRIADNAVVVMETYVDTFGKETTRDIEMRIRMSEGG